MQTFQGSNHHAPVPISEHHDFLPVGSISVGWTKLLEPRAINDFGTIVGYGRFIATSGGPEVTRGFVISTVPEPSSLVLSLLGFSALIGFRAWSARKRRLQAN